MTAPTSPGFGVMLPSFDPFRTGTPPLLAGAELAEELGFDSGWVGDHLSFHPPILEAMTALSAVAGRTERLALGTGVLLLPLRDAVWTAKQLATVDALAPGRLRIGVGVGGENPDEFTAVRVPSRERGRRLDEGLEIVRTLLDGNAVDHPGPLLPTRSPALEPVPPACPPLLVGGRSDAGLRRAARAADGWLGVWMSARRIRETCGRLEELASEYDRAPVPASMMVFVHVTDDGSPARVEAGRTEAAAFVRGQYGLSFDALQRWVLVGSESEVADELAALRAAGAEGLVITPAARDPLEQYRRLAVVRSAIDG